MSSALRICERGQRWQGDEDTLRYYGGITCAYGLAMCIFRILSHIPYNLALAVF